MLDASLARILTLQFLAGRFDPLENQTYTQLTFDEVDTAASRALTADGAQQGMVGRVRASFVNLGARTLLYVGRSYFAMTKTFFL